MLRTPNIAFSFEIDGPILTIKPNEDTTITGGSVLLELLKFASWLNHPIALTTKRSLHDDRGNLLVNDGITSEELCIELNNADIKIKHDNIFLAGSELFSNEYKEFYSHNNNNSNLNSITNAVSNGHFKAYAFYKFARNIRLLNQPLTIYHFDVDAGLCGNLDNKTFTLNGVEITIKTFLVSSSNFDHLFLLAQLLGAHDLISKMDKKIAGLNLAQTNYAERIRFGLTKILCGETLPAISLKNLHKTDQNEAEETSELKKEPIFKTAKNINKLINHLITSFYSKNAIDFYHVRNKDGQPISFFYDRLEKILSQRNKRGLGRSFAKVKPLLKRAGILRFTHERDEIINILDRLHQIYLSGENDIRPNSKKAAIFLALQAVHPQLMHEERIQGLIKLGAFYLKRFDQPEHALIYSQLAFQQAAIGSSILRNEQLLDIIKNAYERLWIKKPKRKAEIQQLAIVWLENILADKQISEINDHPLVELLNNLRAKSTVKDQQQKFLNHLLAMAANKSSSDDIDFLPEELYGESKSAKPIAAIGRYNGIITNWSEQIAKYFGEQPLLAQLWLRSQIDPDDVSALYDLAEEYYYGRHTKANLTIAELLLLRITKVKTLNGSDIYAAKQDEAKKLLAEIYYQELHVINQRVHPDAPRMPLLAAKYLIKYVFSLDRLKANFTVLHLLTSPNIHPRSEYYSNEEFNRLLTLWKRVDFTSPDYIQILFALESFYSGNRKEKSEDMMSKWAPKGIDFKLAKIILDYILHTAGPEYEYMTELSKVYNSASDNTSLTVQVGATTATTSAESTSSRSSSIHYERSRIWAKFKLAKLYLLGGFGIKLKVSEGLQLLKEIYLDQNASPLLRKHIAYYLLFFTDSTQNFTLTEEHLQMASDLMAANNPDLSNLTEAKENFIALVNIALQNKFKIILRKISINDLMAVILFAFPKNNCPNILEHLTYLKKDDAIFNPADVETIQRLMSLLKSLQKTRSLVIDTLQTYDPELNYINALRKNWQADIESNFNILVSADIKDNYTFLEEILKTYQLSKDAQDENLIEHPYIQLIKQFLNRFEQLTNRVTQNIESTKVDLDVLDKQIFSIAQVYEADLRRQFNNPDHYCRLISKDDSSLEDNARIHIEEIVEFVQSAKERIALLRKNFAASLIIIASSRSSTSKKLDPQATELLASINNGRSALYQHIANQLIILIKRHSLENKKLLEEIKTEEIRKIATDKRQVLINYLVEYYKRFCIDLINLRNQIELRTHFLACLDDALRAEVEQRLKAETIYFYQYHRSLLRSAVGSPVPGSLSGSISEFSDFTQGESTYLKEDVEAGFSNEAATSLITTIPASIVSLPLDRSPQLPVDLQDMDTDPNNMRNDPQFPTGYSFNFLRNFNQFLRTLRKNSANPSLAKIEAALAQLLNTPTQIRTDRKAQALAEKGKHLALLYRCDLGLQRGRLNRKPSGYAYYLSDDLMQLILNLDLLKNPSKIRSFIEKADPKIKTAILILISLVIFSYALGIIPWTATYPRTDLQTWPEFNMQNVSDILANLGDQEVGPLLTEAFDKLNIVTKNLRALYSYSINLLINGAVVFALLAIVTCVALIHLAHNIIKNIFEKFGVKLEVVKKALDEDLKIAADETIVTTNNGELWLLWQPTNQAAPVAAQTSSLDWANHVCEFDKEPPPAREVSYSAPSSVNTDSVSNTESSAQQPKTKIKGVFVLPPLPTNLRLKIGQGQLPAETTANREAIVLTQPEPNVKPEEPESQLIRFFKEALYRLGEQGFPIGSNNTKQKIRTSTPGRLLGNAGFYSSSPANESSTTTASATTTTTVTTTTTSTIDSSTARETSSTAAKSRRTDVVTATTPLLAMFREFR